MGPLVERTVYAKDTGLPCEHQGCCRLEGEKRPRTWAPSGPPGFQLSFLPTSLCSVSPSFFSLSFLLSHGPKGLSMSLSQMSGNMADTALKI